MLNYVNRSSITKILYCALFITLGASAEQTTLKITGIGQNGIINTAFLNTARNFEKINPNVKVQIQLQSDKAFKENLPYVFSKKSNVDLVILHAGERLKNAIIEKRVIPITSTWSRHDLDQKFTLPMKNVVSHNQDIYAIPYSYYLWGFYYKKSFFNSLKLQAPVTWADFNEVLTTLKQNNVNSVYIGTKNPWPIGAWFEYLNLRINGIEFHNKFVNFEINSNSKEISSVLRYLKQLVDQQYFTKDHHNKTLAGGLPALMRNKVGVILVGGAFENFLPESLKKDVGFFPFPQIDTKMPIAQVSPIDVMALSSYSKHPEIARKFLAYIAQADVQSIHNTTANQLPVNMHASTSDKGTSHESLAYLRQADELTLFYDREVEKQYGLQNLAIWKAFLDNSNIEFTQQEMEKSRQGYINRKNKPDKSKALNNNNDNVEKKQ